MQMYLFSCSEIKHLGITKFPRKLILLIIWIDSDLESGEAVVVVSCTDKHWSRVGTCWVHNLHLVTCWRKQTMNRSQDEVTKVNYYHPQRSWGKVIFSQASVILFTGGRWLCTSMHHRLHDQGVSVQRVSVQGGLCTGGVSVWGSLSGEVSVQWGFLSKGVLCPRGFSIQGGFCLGVSVRGSLSRGVSVQVVFVQGGLC